ncbi:MAG: 2-oxoglutarate dehydrogenase E1 component [Saprospiraceae bacterium]
MKDYSYVFNAHPSFIENLYKRFQKAPEDLEEGWKVFFRGFEFGHNIDGQMTMTSTETNGVIPSEIAKEFDVLSIIHGYRSRGHLLSTTNPVRPRKDRKPFLAIDDYNLENNDLKQSFKAAEEMGMQGKNLGELLEHLNKLYCGNIGFEYSHIENREKRMWLRVKIENRELTSAYGLDQSIKKRILEKLNGAVGFESFLNTKYVGQKRFSLEGGESVIAALDRIITVGGENGVQEVIIGMAHRGRLNVLANIMGKTYDSIFNEFEGESLPEMSHGDGDVKYHLGFSSQVTTPKGHSIHLKLIPNPSHLEAVNPVVEGFSRAKADILYKSDYDKILPILIHGDAAVAGQGVVYETVQMSQLEGYYTGGTIHIVINNQVGFTTDFHDARSSTYATAASGIVQAPVFHVNGDDPEALIWAVNLATEYRQKFNNDVFIDVVCYRKHGHNEGDDPKFTQPHLYDLIKKHKDPRKIYVERLLQRGDVDKDLAEGLEKNFWNDLQARLNNVKQKPLPYQYQEPEKGWKSLKKTKAGNDFEHSPKTGIPKKEIEDILDHLVTLPDDFTPMSKVNRLLKGMNKLLNAGTLDWAFAELLAYGSILREGHDVRLTGQDVLRGTFSHRHAIFKDDKTFKAYNRLEGMTPEQGAFRIYNSFLSEYAVLGFEYGYSLASPDNLVIWEAQFGDFHNGAQIMIDQFIAAGESKWRRMSGLVMLLPHGYAGQGPEHSSARMERFLQMCAEYNMTVANITTPANFFHVLKRQLKRPFRKPLIVLSPKSLLRHPECVSKIKDFQTGTHFQEVIDDHSDTKKVTTLLLCTGKIFYDLNKYKSDDKRDDVAIVRLEQIYPYPKKKIEAIFTKYKGATIKWVQEEPLNMGAWQYLLSFWRNPEIQEIGRRVSSSPATGFKKIHDQQQKEIIEKAFS